MFGSVVWSAAFVALGGVLLVGVSLIGIARAERRGRAHPQRRLERAVGGVQAAGHPPREPSTARD